MKIGKYYETDHFIFKVISVPENFHSVRVTRFSKSNGQVSKGIWMRKTFLSTHLSEYQAKLKILNIFKKMGKRVWGEIKGS